MPFLIQINRGRLVLPCVEVETIVSYTNNVVEPLIDGKHSQISSLNVLVLRKVLELINLRNDTLLCQLDEHVDVLLYKSHRLKLIEFVVTKFVNMRMRHFSKHLNESMKKKMIRKKLTKLIHFSNQ